MTTPLFTIFTSELAIYIAVDQYYYKHWLFNKYKTSNSNMLHELKVQKDLNFGVSKRINPN